MQTTKLKKKGFTLVELVIVVAVIAVLSAILIPTIGCFVEEAKETADVAYVKLLNTALAEDEAKNDKPETCGGALQVVKTAGYSVEKLTKLTSGTALWDSKNNRFMIINGKSVVYRDNSATETANIDLWQIITPASGISSVYSNYLLVGDYSGLKADGVLVFSTGFDIGDNSSILNVKYARASSEKEQTASVYTNSYDVELTVDAANDNVNHYGELGSLDIENVKPSSYHEYGKVKAVRIKNGHFIAELGCELGSAVQKVEGGTATLDVAKAVIWSDVVYAWADDYSTCTATRTSSDDKTETETVTAVETIVKAATTEEAGSKTYTATFTNPAFETKVQEVEIPRILTQEEQLINEVNALLKADEEINGKPATMHAALTVLGDKRTAVMNDYSATLLWDSVDNEFCTIAASDAKIAADSTRKEYEFWQIISVFNTATTTYSYYLADNYTYSTSITNLKTGLDVGNNTSITDITYAASYSVVIRTLTGTLTIKTGTATHYGLIEKVTFANSKAVTYIEKGKVNDLIDINKKNVTVDISSVTEKAARAIVVRKSDAKVIGNNQTPVCYTTTTKPNNISGVDNGNDIGQIDSTAFKNFSEGFGTASNPFIIKDSTDWNNAWNANNSSLTLYFALGNTFEVATNISTLAMSANTVLDLNGHTLNLKDYSTIQVGAYSLTIKDSKGTGKIIKTDNSVRGLFSSYASNAKLIIEGGTFSGNALVGQSGNSTETSIDITVTGGTFNLQSLKTGEITLATVTINGGSGLPNE